MFIPENGNDRVTVSSPQEAQALLERKILKGLVQEWKTTVNWALHMRFRHHASAYLAMVPCPAFMLKDMAALGTWERNIATISLQRNLVLEHPWSAVVEVLKHEIAHQLADQLFRASADQTMHGKAFQEACSILHIVPRASSRVCTLREHLQNCNADESDRLLAKVRKLLALAEGGNTHEAESALAKAQTLIARYNLELLDHQRQREYYSIALGAPHLRHSRVHNLLGDILRKHYFVEIIWVPTWVKEQEKIGYILEISGTAENLRLAEYVYHFVLRFIDSRWLEFAGRRRLGVRRKRDFSIGVLAGFRGRLDREREEARCAKHSTVESRALVASQDPGLKDYHAFRYPNPKIVSRYATKRDAESYKAGLQEGANLAIREGLESGEGQPQRFLPKPGN